MMLTASDLAQFIEANNIAAELIFLDVDTPTVTAAAQAVNAYPEKIGKSVLFLVDKRPLLIIGNGLRRIEQKLVAQYCGVGRKRVRLANADQVLAITGYRTGTVPPFGHPQPIPTLVDSHVLTNSEIYAGGGAINTLIHLTTAELQHVTQAEVVSLTSD